MALPGSFSDDTLLALLAFLGQTGSNEDIQRKASEIGKVLEDSPVAMASTAKETATAYVEALKELDVDRIASQLVLKNPVPITVSPHQKPAELSGPRIYMDGIFDLCHAGHYNAIRQASKLGATLTVGVCSDHTTKVNKGSFPIFSHEERAELMAGCKWVDLVIRDAPYSPDCEYLERVNCDFGSHGDDIAPDETGQDCYRFLRAKGKLLLFNRTIGISSSALMCKLLRAAVSCTPDEESIKVGSPKNLDRWLTESAAESLLSSRTAAHGLQIVDFIGDRKKPEPGAKIVYVGGSFDLFHVGHLRILQQAKARGDYLLVGVHDDATVKAYKGSGFPIMSMLERAMSLLAMRAVDDIILGAPWCPTETFIRQFKINVVVAGRKPDVTCLQTTEGTPPQKQSPDDLFKVPREMGILQDVDSGSSLTTAEILMRALRNQELLMSVLMARSEKEKRAQQSALQSLEENTAC